MNATTCSYAILADGKRKWSKWNDNTFSGYDTICNFFFFFYCIVFVFYGRLLLLLNKFNFRSAFSLSLFIRRWFNNHSLRIFIGFRLNLCDKCVKWEMNEVNGNKKKKTKELFLFEASILYSLFFSFVCSRRVQRQYNFRSSFSLHSFVAGAYSNVLYSKLFQFRPIAYALRSKEWVSQNYIIEKPQMYILPHADNNTKNGILRKINALKKKE